MDIIEKLEAYCKNAIPMHMPGHKRNLDIIGNSDYLNRLSADLDITEIDGFDNLNKPEGIIRDSMERASDLWGSGESLYLVNGSTSGILSAIYSCTRLSKKILVARNSHKSVYNAIRLFELEPVFVIPEKEDNLFGCGRVSAKRIRLLLEKNPDVKTVIITSPTYEGIISDIRKIAEVVHTMGAVLIVDEAHGAHLGLYDVFPQNALQLGADIVIQSIHKTLPSLTSTAIIHISKDFLENDEKNKIIIEELKRAVTMFTTSSPSYLLISSIDSCVTLLKEKGEKLLKNWHLILEAFYDQTRDIKSFKVLTPFEEKDICLKASAHVDVDPSKIIIGGVRGECFAQLLRIEYGIEVEMAAVNYVIAMTGLGDTAVSLKTFSDALHDIDRRIENGELADSLVWTGNYLDYMPELPQSVIPISKAYIGNSKKVLMSNSQNMISAEYIWAYPPGIPIIVPGEQINRSVIDYINIAISNGKVLHSDRREQIGNEMLVSDIFT